MTEVTYCSCTHKVLILSKSALINHTLGNASGWGGEMSISNEFGIT